MLHSDALDVRGIHSGDHLVAMISLFLMPKRDELGIATIEIKINSGYGNITALEVKPSTEYSANERDLVEKAIDRCLKDSTLTLANLGLVHPNYDHPVTIELRGIALVTPQHPSAEP